MRTQSAHRSYFRCGTCTDLSIAILSLLFCLLTSHPTFADQPSPTDRQTKEINTKLQELEKEFPDTQTEVSRMDEVVRYYVDAKKFMGSVLVARNDQILLDK